jgi:uncharacterized protein YoxC
MAEAKRNLIVVGCAIVGCVVTLLTCGVLIGNIQGEVRGISGAITNLQADVKTITTAQTDMKSKQAYLEGVVSTKLDTIQTGVANLEKQVDDLVRVN